MREKIKYNTGFFFNLIKSAMLGVGVSVALVLALAFVLKFVEMSDRMITVIDEIIKIVSIFISVIKFAKKSPYKILLKSALVGAVYTILTFILFSALKGSYNFGASLVIDIIFGAIIGIVISIIMNIFSKDKVVV